MPWNEPNSSEKDPWGNRNKPQSPPHLDEVIRNLYHKLQELLTGKRPTPANSTNKNVPSSVLPLIGAIVTFLLLIWLGLGIYMVGPAEQAVILRFGRYVRTEGPGLHWLPQFIESKQVLNVQQVTAYQYDADMLTADENIVNVTVVVQFRISNPKEYLFNVVDPVNSLQQATASALRQVIGNSQLDNILTKGRAQITQEIFQQLSSLLQSYNTGIEILDVAMQPAKPPEEVTQAFDDAIKAREDEQRYINQAQSYENTVIPQAQGQAQMLLQQAQAYKQQVILNAQGETARFLSLLDAYTASPAITRERMYLETMQQVLQNSRKVLIDTPNSNNVMYLPLNNLFNSSLGNLQDANNNTTTSANASNNTNTTANPMSGGKSS